MQKNMVSTLQETQHGLTNVDIGLVRLGIV